MIFFNRNLKYNFLKFYWYFNLKIWVKLFLMVNESNIKNFSFQKKNFEKTFKFSKFKPKKKFFGFQKKKIDSRIQLEKKSFLYKNESYINKNIYSINKLRSKKSVIKTLYSCNKLKLTSKKFNDFLYKKSLNFYIKRTQFFNLLKNWNYWDNVLITFSDIWNWLMLEHYDNFGLFLTAWNFFSQHAVFFIEKTKINYSLNLPHKNINIFYRKLFKGFKQLNKKLILFYSLNKWFNFNSNNLLSKSLFEWFFKPFCLNFFEKTNKTHRYFFLSKYNIYWWILSRKPLFFKNYLSPNKKIDSFLYWYPHMGVNYFFWTIISHLLNKNKSIVELNLFPNKFNFWNFLINFNNNIINKLNSNLFTKRTDVYFKLIGNYFNFLSKKMFSRSDDWVVDLLKSFPILFDNSEFKFNLNSGLLSDYSSLIIGWLYRFLYTINWSTAKKYYWYFFDKKHSASLDYFTVSKVNRFNLSVTKGLKTSWINFESFWKKFIYEERNFNYWRLLREIFPKQRFVDATLWKIGYQNTRIQFFNFFWILKTVEFLTKKKTLSSKLTTILDNFFLKKYSLIKKRIELRFLINDLSYNRFFYIPPFSSFLNFYENILQKWIKNLNLIKGDFFSPLSLILCSNIYFEPFSALNKINLNKFYFLSIWTYDSEDLQDAYKMYTRSSFANSWSTWISANLWTKHLFLIIKKKNEFFNFILQNFLIFKKFLFVFFFFKKNLDIYFKKKLSIVINFYIFARLGIYKKLKNIENSNLIFKNFLFLSWKFSQSFFSKLLTTKVNKKFVFTSTLKVKWNLTMIPFWYVGNNISKKTGVLIGTNFHFNLLISSTFCQFTLNWQNAFFFPFPKRKKLLWNYKSIYKMFIYINSKIDYFYIKFLFFDNFDYLNSYFSNTYFNLFNKNSIKNFIKKKIYNIKKKDFFFNKKSFYYWYRYVLYFEKYNIYNLTSKIKRKNKKINLFYLPVTIMLNSKNNKLLEKNSKTFFNYSIFIETISSLEVESLKFSDFIFFFKIEPKKYFLGSIGTSTFTSLNNNFFFFVKSYFDDLFNFNKYFDDLILYNNYINFQLYWNFRVLKFKYNIQSFIEWKFIKNNDYFNKFSTRKLFKNNHLWWYYYGIPSSSKYKFSWVNSYNQILVFLFEYVWFYTNSYFNLYSNDFFFKINLSYNMKFLKFFKKNNFYTDKVQKIFFLKSMFKRVLNKTSFYHKFYDTKSLTNISKFYFIHTFSNEYEKFSKTLGIKKKLFYLKISKISRNFFNKNKLLFDLAFKNINSIGYYKKLFIIFFRNNFLLNVKKTKSINLTFPKLLLFRKNILFFFYTQKFLKIILKTKYFYFVQNKIILFLRLLLLTSRIFKLSLFYKFIINLYLCNKWQLIEKKKIKYFESYNTFFFLSNIIILNNTLKINYLNLYYFLPNLFNFEMQELYSKGLLNYNWIYKNFLNYNLRNKNLVFTFSFFFNHLFILKILFNKTNCLFLQNNKIINFLNIYYFVPIFFFWNFFLFFKNKKVLFNYSLFKNNEFNFKKIKLLFPFIKSKTNLLNFFVSKVENLTRYKFFNIKKLFLLKNKKKIIFIKKNDLKNFKIFWHLIKKWKYLNKISFKRNFIKVFSNRLKLKKIFFKNLLKKIKKRKFISKNKKKKYFKIKNFLFSINYRQLLLIYKNINNFFFFKFNYLNSLCLKELKYLSTIKLSWSTKFKDSICYYMILKNFKFFYLKFLNKELIFFFNINFLIYINVFFKKYINIKFTDNFNFTKWLNFKNLKLSIKLLFHKMNKLLYLTYFFIVVYKKNYFFNWYFDFLKIIFFKNLYFLLFFGKFLFKIWKYFKYFSIFIFVYDFLKNNTIEKIKINFNNIKINCNIKLYININRWKLNNFTKFQFLFNFTKLKFFNLVKLPLMLNLFKFNKFLWNLNFKKKNYFYWMYKNSYYIHKFFYWNLISFKSIKNFNISISSIFSIYFYYLLKNVF